MRPLVKALRNGELMSVVVCCLALLLCVLLATPFINSAFNDDWAYSHVALRLAQTGRIEHGGWGSPTILFQCIWAAIFIKLFGFSFSLLRIVTLPFSLGVAGLTYLLARKIGLYRDLARFAGLTLAISPLFIPLAASFMTEPYACFFSLLCVYGAVCCTQARTPNAAIAWLWIVAFSGILGGSDRQTVWLAPLVLLPFLGWLRRAERKFSLHFALAYATCLLSLALVLAKFSPKYGPTEISRSQWLNLVILNGSTAAHYVVSVLLVVALMCLPVLCCLMPQWRKLSFRQWEVLAIGCVVAFDYMRSGFGYLLGVVPFLGNILTPFGVLDDATGGLGTRPLVLHLGVRFAVTFLLLFAAGAWLYLSHFTIKPRLEAQPAAAVFTLFVVPYFILLIPGALLTYCYDRYALPLMPLFIIVLLLPLQGRIERIPAAAWVCLLIFAGYGTATTHDRSRNLEARAQAASRMVQRGIAATHISAGLERDGWLQLQTAGKIGTMLYGVDPMRDNRFWFWYYTPTIQPDYVVVSSDLRSVPPQALLRVPFTTWAPFSRQAAYVLRRQDLPSPKPNK